MIYYAGNLESSDSTAEQYLLAEPMRPGAAVVVSYPVAGTSAFSGLTLGDVFKVHKRQVVSAPRALKAASGLWKDPCRDLKGA